MSVNAKNSTMTVAKNTGDTLQLKRLELLFSQSTFSFVGNGIAGLLIVVLFWQQHSQILLSLWFAANTLILIARGLFSRAYIGGRLADKTYSWLLNSYNLGAVATGIIWSIIGIYICETGNLYSSAVILLTIGCIVAGSVAIYAVAFSSFVAFSFTTTVPICIYFLFKANYEQILMAILALLFLATMTILSHQLNKILIKYFSYEKENIFLFNKLENEKQLIIKLNNDLQGELSKQKQAETELKAEKAKVDNLVDKLLKLSMIDGLTEIPNRRHFDEYMGKEWSRCSREKIPLSLILCDIDYFKAYNDRYGHLEGDKCLRNIAAVLSEYARRGGDMAARYGGEEFAIILPNTSKENAAILAEQIHLAIGELAMEHKGSKVSNIITASFGVATIIPDREIRSTVLVSLADKALYQAKQNGRNQVVTMDPEIVNAAKSIA